MPVTLKQPSLSETNQQPRGVRLANVFVQYVESNPRGVRGSDSGCSIVGDEGLSVVCKRIIVAPSSRRRFNILLLTVRHIGTTPGNIGRVASGQGSSQ